MLVDAYVFDYFTDIFRNIFLFQNKVWLDITKNNTNDTFLESQGQILSNPTYIGLIYGLIELIKGGNFDPTPLDRVDKFISYDIKLTNIF